MEPSQRGLPVVVNTGRRKPCLIPMVGVVANRLYTHLKAASTLFAVGDVPVERVGWLSHSLQQGAHVARSDPKSKVLRHPCGHLIARQAFGNKFLKIVDMSDVPSCASCHVMNLVGRSIPCNDARFDLDEWDNIDIDLVELPESVADFVSGPPRHHEGKHYHSCRDEQRLQIDVPLAGLQCGSGDDE
jgi:hypothetical protein